MVAALALLWPAFVNGGPFWFPDTSNYVRAADGAAVFVTNSPSVWSDRLQVDRPPAGNPGAVEELANPALDGSRISGEIKPTRPVLVGRSIYYGFLLYAPMRLFGPWGAVFLQALIVAGILLITASIISREIGRMPPGPTAALVAALLIASPLPFFTSMLIPDVYSGLLVLCFATVVAFWSRLRKVELIALIAICAVIATFHTTHILIVAAAGIVAAVFALGGNRMRAILIALPIVAAGALSVAAFNLAVSFALGERPVSPPFLSARLTDAGPGTVFLQERCGDAGVDFVLCRYRDRLPVPSDAFLWDEKAATGVYQLFSDAERAQVSREDVPFFLAVLAHDPIGLVGVSLHSFVQQLFHFDMSSFNYSQDHVQSIGVKYPAPVAATIRPTLAANMAMPLLPTVMLTIATTLAALTMLAALFVQAERREGPRHLAWSWAALVLLAVLANAAICGALSGPHGRYQMRLIWLLPFVAGSLWVLRQRTSRPVTTGADRRAAGLERASGLAEERSW
ncbi:hypothetical protein [Porphyrobacter sp. GA68]|uniref:hypothetical protein n=1 Tax=Porphyrobacter sp. GA68 TaxID=2883480 RepID=UPI001D180BAA|nr:hypothetical protein [Porphyrobacter sp. GA68]